MDDKKQKLLMVIPAAVLAATLLIAVILLIVRAFTQDSGNEFSTSAAFIQRRDFLFEEKLRVTAQTFGISGDNFTTDIDLEELQTLITIRFPRAKLIEEFIMQIFAVVENTDYRIVESKHIRRGRTPGRREFVRMVFENKRRANEKIICEIVITNEAAPSVSRTAFLIRGIDRLSDENAQTLLKLGQPLSFILTPWTVSFSPDSPIAAQDGEPSERRRRTVTDTVAGIFNQLILPVLIEIPIEDNQTHFERRRYTIAQADSRRRMTERINMLTKMFPDAAGLFATNGNLVLNSRPSAQNFLNSVRRRNLIFVDARRTARNSTARELAREINAPYDTISFWLPSDGERGLSVSQWEAQIRNVADRAAQNRTSTVFVAADDNFVEAFIRTLPHIQRRGIRLVPITHL